VPTPAIARSQSDMNSRRSRMKSIVFMVLDDWRAKTNLIRWMRVENLPRVCVFPQHHLVRCKGSTKESTCWLDI
jgi:hypothetical protein